MRKFNYSSMASPNRKSKGFMGSAGIKERWEVD
jgi:hypothetical protein